MCKMSILGTLKMVYWKGERHKNNAVPVETSKIPFIAARLKTCCLSCSLFELGAWFSLRSFCLQKFVILFCSIYIGHNTPFKWMPKIRGTRAVLYSIGSFWNQWLFQRLNGSASQKRNTVRLMLSFVTGLGKKTKMSSCLIHEKLSFMRDVKDGSLPFVNGDWGESSSHPHH